MSQHCPTCACGKRAPICGTNGSLTISWQEHCNAWQVYSKKYGTSQSPDVIASRGGFYMEELVDFLGHRPLTISSP